jgi:hypothetical protein
MPENIRSHVVLAAITLILAIVVLGLLFVHPGPTIQQGLPPGSGIWLSLHNWTMAHLSILANRSELKQTIMPD